MSDQGLFGVIGRTIGLLIMLVGLYALTWGFVYSVWEHYKTDAAGKTGELASAGQQLFIGIVFALFGAFLISQADVIVGLAY